jgi:hypothetical protein
LRELHAKAREKERADCLFFGDISDVAFTRSKGSGRFAR